MELHNGKLFWEEITEDIEMVKTDSHPKNRYDIIIIGGGMSGALSGYILAKEGSKIAIIDKQKMGTGSTLANTGLLQYSNDMMLSQLIEKIGKDKAVRFYQLCREAMDQLRAVAKEIGSQADFLNRSSFYYASEESHVDLLKAEYQALSENGFEVEYLSEEDIREQYPFTKPAALRTHGDAEVNPFSFNRDILAELSKKENVDLFENVEVIETKEMEDNVEILTSKGIFKAEHIIFATGYNKSLSFPGVAPEINRSYAIATEPIADLTPWKDREMIWETKRPYLYLRTTADGRIIAGGLDEEKPHAPKKERTIEDHAKELQEKVQALFPMFNTEIAYSWGAVFGESADGLPFIGRLPNKERTYCLLGYGGNGTVYSMLGAHILRDIITGKHNPDAEIVQLNRNRN
ncbi:NAD(P)/FAD-dependent oxidoreductase [Cytobacillus gottheilii]|uniref:NAD(P)/FAD-dependent oxidoreductase n=1 Tax=Cytobacillus gottheilii TaxID=859144 RepID=UPI0009BAD3F7|nr:FAD-binding oxidoreductase [Cytobacillus gottheilii]